jgi:hypothetical protein
MRMTSVAQYPKQRSQAAAKALRYHTTGEKSPAECGSSSLVAAIRMDSLRSPEEYTTWRRIVSARFFLRISLETVWDDDDSHYLYQMS